MKSSRAQRGKELITGEQIRIYELASAHLKTIHTPKGSRGTWLRRRPFLTVGSASRILGFFIKKALVFIRNQPAVHGNL
jgi:hypothetical protein